MTEKLMKLWETQKTMCIILGILLLPITLAIIGYKVYSWWNGFAAKKSLDEAQKKDDKLAAEEDSLKKAADSFTSKADEAAKRIEDRKEEEVDLDWHTKRKD